MAWLKAHEQRPTDEYFWHATTTQNVRKIYESGAIKPEFGGGGNGIGFYVSAAITDYIKIMAYRSIKPADWQSMFILKILCRGFYDMKPFFSDDGLAGAVGNEAGDFVAARWSAEISGETSYRTPTGEMTRYDSYQGKQIPTIGFKDGVKDFTVGKGWKEKAKSRQDAFDALWDCAKRNVIDTDNPSILPYMQLYGPRGAFLRTIEEITFKQSAGPSLHVVGARRYHINDKPDDGLFANDVECSLDHVEAVISLD